MLAAAGPQGPRESRDRFVLDRNYAAFRNLKYVINRFGIVSGKGQFGIKEQGIMSYWLKQHVVEGQLDYYGYGGGGKQVRDALHILDLCCLVDLQIHNISSVAGETFNIGGGKSNSFSLFELTQLCQEITGNIISIGQFEENRAGDIPIYYTDNTKIIERLNWEPSCNVNEILLDLFNWYSESKFLFN